MTYNSSRKPITSSVDFRASRSFVFQKLNFTLFARIKNLFDTLNENIVYNDSGQAGYTRYKDLAKAQNTDESINTIDQWFENETFYSNPRRVEIGLNIDF